MSLRLSVLVRVLLRQVRTRSTADAVDSRAPTRGRSSAPNVAKLCGRCSAPSCRRHRRNPYSKRRDRKYRGPRATLGIGCRSGVRYLDKTASQRCTKRSNVAQRPCTPRTEVPTMRYRIEQKIETLASTRHRLANGRGRSECDVARPVASPLGRWARGGADLTLRLSTGVRKPHRGARANPSPNAGPASWWRVSGTKSLRTPDTAPPALRPLRRPVPLDKVERIVI